MTIAIIFAGGSGVRMGAQVPKQFLEMNGKPVLIHTVLLFQTHPQIDSIRIVAQKDYFGKVESLCKIYGISKFDGIVEGGESAQESIYNGLISCRQSGAPDNTVVLLHDGVRPYITHEVISANIASVQAYGNGVTFTPCYETLVISKDGKCINDIPLRSESFSAQAPQSFRLGSILAAHNRVRNMPSRYEGLVDQATILWKLGIPIHLVPGNRGNIKITTKEDIIMLEALLKRKNGDDNP